MELRQKTKEFMKAHRDLLKNNDLEQFYRLMTEEIVNAPSDVSNLTEFFMSKGIDVFSYFEKKYSSLLLLWFEKYRSCCRS